MRRLWFAAMLCAALTVPVLTAAPAGAASASPLTGEALLENYTATATPRISGTCNPDGTTTLSITSTGSAFNGAYPGTYSETATATIAPQTGRVIPEPPSEPLQGSFGFATGELTAFDATFTITSGTTTITGEKHLDLSRSPLFLPTRPLFTDPGNAGICVEGGPLTSPFFTGPPLYGYFKTFDASTVSYAATIATPSGTFHDHGAARTVARNTCADFDPDPACTAAPSPGGSRVGLFLEAFKSDLTQLDESHPASITLTPPDATNVVGTTHTVVASVADQNGAPFQGVMVQAGVSGAVSASLSCVTAADGSCSLSYVGPNFPGADLIAAYADSDGDGAQDVGEPSAEATKAWVLPSSTTGQVTGGGQVLNSAATDEVAFGFNAQNGTNGPKGNCNLVDPAPAVNTKIKCLDVTALVVSGNAATIWGNATLNGTETGYRIDIVDNGEPGTADSFRIATGTGYAAGGTLRRGNIQLH